MFKLHTREGALKLIKFCFKNTFYRTQDELDEGLTFDHTEQIQNDLQNTEELNLSKNEPELSQNDFSVQTAKSDDQKNDNRSPDRRQTPEPDEETNRSRSPDRRQILDLPETKPTQFEAENTQNRKSKNKENTKCGCCCGQIWNQISEKVK